MRSKAIILNATIFSLSLILGGQVAFAQSADTPEKGRGSSRSQHGVLKSNRRMLKSESCHSSPSYDHRSSRSSLGTRTIASLRFTSAAWLGSCGVLAPRRIGSGSWKSATPLARLG